MNGYAKVSSIEKLVGETKSQLGMVTQIRDADDAQRIGQLRPHSQRVGVVEPQRTAHAEPLFAQGGGKRCFTLEFASRENLTKQGAGIFGIGIDLTHAKGVPQHSRAAELPSVRSVGTGVVGEMRQHVTEDHRFGELFRTNVDFGGI